MFLYTISLSEHIAITMNGIRPEAEEDQQFIDKVVGFATRVSLPLREL
jgi:hypothetical protein